MRTEHEIDTLTSVSDSTRQLHVDGMDGPTEDGVFAGDGTYPPFVVFDADKQENIAGPFADRMSAEIHRSQILQGATPKLDVNALRIYPSSESQPNEVVVVKKTPAAEISTLVHAAYLTKGFFSKPQPQDANCPEYEVVEAIVAYANSIAAALDEVRARDIQHPGVFEYEVTEELGAWLRINPDASHAEFVVELVRQAEGFFGCDCNFIATALMPNLPIKMMGYRGRGAVLVKSEHAPNVASEPGFGPG